ncbi:MAG TPA: nuclease A inhibitor family protein, partial [Longimicrobiaceae bacterium]|nr:nuclease A inhibitor family protein [Longimicrobiaceae bacterium]
VYTSESDRPFTWLVVPGGGEGWPYPADELARRLGTPPGTRVEERDLDDFLARHIETSDPYDVRAQRIRPRYEALRALLRRTLREPRVVRLGRHEVRCLVVGADADGNLAGLETVAVET